MTPEEIEPRVSAAFRLLQHELDDSLFCPRNGHAFEQVPLMVVSRALRMGLAVCHLVAGGFFGEGFGLTRSVLEAFLIVKYVSTKDSEVRSQSYLDYTEAYYFNQEEIRKMYFPHLDRPEGVPQELLDRVRQRFGPTPRKWVAAYNMATEYYDHPSEINPATGKGYQALSDYLGMYEMTSHYVHVQSFSTRGNYYASPFHCARHDEDDDRGILALYFSLAYCLQICVLVGRAWDAVLPDSAVQTVTDLLSELRTATSVNRSGVWGVPKKP
jgi:hypothetical protein